MTSVIFNSHTLSQQREELIAEIQNILKTAIIETIKIKSNSSINSKIVLHKHFIRLDLTDYNFVPPKIMPSKLLGSVYSRDYTNPSCAMTNEEIVKAVDVLIEKIATLPYQPVRDHYEECSICYEMTNKITKCNHPLCNACWDKIDDIYEKKMDDIEREAEMNNRDVDFEDERTAFPCCPICRNSVM